MVFKEMKTLMKKYFLLGALTIGSLAFAQYYPNYGNSYPNDGYYSTESDWGYDDGFYDYAYDNFPDSYYYEYPVDYYPSEYYQSYYNDYRRSIAGTDWERLFMEFNLSQSQIRRIMMLNQRFSNYAAWSAFYGMNPDRWYYDRFYALERILGPRIFVIFQNRYYNGYSPIRYWQNYRRTYYIPRYQPVYRYRNVNTSTYYVGRDRYFQDYGSRYGNNRRSMHSPEGLSGGNYGNSRIGNSGSARVSGTVPQGDNGFRNGSGQFDNWSRTRTESRPSSTWQNESSSGSSRNGGGFRSGGSADIRTAPSARSTDAGSVRSSGGFRAGGSDSGNSSGQSARTSGGMRTGAFR